MKEVITGHTHILLIDGFYIYLIVNHDEHMSHILRAGYLFKSARIPIFIGI